MIRLPFAICSLLSLPAAAVVISGGTGAGNTSAPVDDPGFANIGKLNSASAIYLGNRWVLTAHHVANSLPASVNFGGTSYATEAATWQRLNNNSTPGMTVSTDLVLFRLATDPGLASLSISSAPTVTSDPLVMIGNGRNRATSLTSWDVTVGPGSADDVWTVVTPPPPADRSGYLASSGNSIRWGENLTSSTGLDVTGSHGTVRSFTTTFTDGGGAVANEAQAVQGDSGGAVFIKNGGNWELTGMIHAVANFENQPGGTTSAVFGNGTYIADLSFYGAQIEAIVAVPEPALTMLYGLAGISFALRRRRVTA